MLKQRHRGEREHVVLLKRQELLEHAPDLRISEAVVVLDEAGVLVGALREQHRQFGRPLADGGDLPGRFLWQTWRDGLDRAHE